MKYQPPFGSTDPNASYVDANVPGAVRGSAVPGRAIEDPQRELDDFIAKSGFTPTEAVLQLAAAIQSGKVTYAVASGSANAWVVDPVLAVPAYAAGRVLWIIAPATNTSGTVNANVSGLGNRRIKRRDGSDPAIGDLVSGTAYPTIDDGTNIRVLTALPSDIKSASFQLTRQVITATGSYSFTVPAGVLRVRLKLWGGGGGGGGASFGSPGGAASGGGGGAYLERVLTVNAGDTISGSVGAGGAGGQFSPSVSPVAGGNTTAIHNATTYTAAGGAAGLNAGAGVAQNSVSGGSPTNGDVTSRAGNVSASGFFSNNGTVVNPQGGKGGASPLGGDGGNGGLGNGNPGVAPGGGGAGAGGTSGSNQIGGDGARGEVWIEY